MTFKPTAFVWNTRCGSTSIGKFLGAHGALTSVPKEPFYFECGDEFDQKIDYYQQKYFASWRGQDVIVDCRPQLVMLPWAVPRVMSECPDARVVATLRDPVERCWSQYQLRYLYGLEKRSFDEVVSVGVHRASQYPDGSYLDDPDAETSWCASLTDEVIRFTWTDYYLEMGMYAVNLRRWLDAGMAREQFCIIDFAELSLPETAARILDHVGLPADPDAILPHHNSWRQLLPPGQDVPSMSSEARSALNDFYAPHDALLTSLLGWDKCPWQP